MTSIDPTSGREPPRHAETNSWSACASIEGLVYGFGDRAGSAPAFAATTVRQVHGIRVLCADDLGPGALDPEADALTVSGAGRVVAVRTADCVPVLMAVGAAGAAPRWAAAVHAGWRGTLAGVVDAAVESARRAGHDPGSLWAALGPSIGPCCYEVSPELAADFARAGYAVIEGRPRPRLDLRAINRRRLIDLGLSAGRVELLGPCTRCAADRYYSYRADSNEGGRQLSWIGWEARTPHRDR